MKRLSKVVNIVPVIAKADTLTLEERVYFKQRVGRPASTGPAPGDCLERQAVAWPWPPPTPGTQRGASSEPPGDLFIERRPAAAWGLGEALQPHPPAPGASAWGLLWDFPSMPREGRFTVQSVSGGGEGTRRPGAAPGRGVLRGDVTAGAFSTACHVAGAAVGRDS